MKLVIDTETNRIDFNGWNAGDTSSLKKLHCICAIDVDTGEEYRYHGRTVNRGLTHAYSADLLIGHYIDFDLRVMAAWKGVRLPSRVDTFCTYMAAKSTFPDGYRENRIANPNLKGRHSLEAWGSRLGVRKGGAPQCWDQPDMKLLLDYCIQDCRVALALYRLLARRRG